MTASSEPEESEGTMLAVREETSPTLYGTTDSELIVALATKQANALAEVVRKKNLISKISGREHVRVEGWTLLGTFLGVYPVETFTRAIPEDWRERGMEKPEGYESRVEARTKDGGIVGAANGRVMFDETNWTNKPDYALASMAQTRAVSKALRMPLGFVVVLAGFEATPSEEADGFPLDDRDESFDKATPAKRSTAKKSTAKKSTATKKPAAKSATEPAADGDLRALWKQATDLLGNRGEVVKWYRDLFDVAGSVNPRDVTAEQLKEIVAAATEAKKEETS